MLLKYVRKLFRGRYKMAGYDYQDELYRAQQRELELQRQLGMKDGASNPRENRIYAPVVYSATKAKPHVVFGALGVFFLFLGVILLMVLLAVGTTLEKEYERCTQETKAIVTENKLTSRGTFKPVFSFSTSSGTYTVESSIAQSPAKYTVGQEVTIHYDPDDPYTFYDEKVDTLVKIILGSIGGFFIIFGFIMIFVGIKIKKHPRTPFYQ